MPDLSNLLGAVYGDGPSSNDREPEDEAHVEHEPAAEERGPAVPDWADDEHLDAAFAQWKPGPPEDAGPAEHAFVKDTSDDPPPPLADDLAAALSEALVASSGAADDTDDYGFKPAKVVDFSDPDDEPATTEVEGDARAETEQPPELGEVVEEGEPQEADDHLRHLPAITPQRAAAAELTAANRVEPNAAAARSVPESEPAMPTAMATPVPAPATPPPAPASVDASAPVASVPDGARRWERGEDDILPEKPSKKFFSFSLRRG